MAGRVQAPRGIGTGPGGACPFRGGAKDLVEGIDARDGD